MPTELKVQIVFAVLLAVELLGFIRTVANLEYAFARTEEIVNREVQLSARWREQERVSREKAQQVDSKNQNRNELLLNIPFMERLNREKKGG